MTIAAQLLDHPRHTLAVLTGDGDLDEFVAVLRRIAQETRTAQQLALLIDMRNVRALERFTDQFSAGLEAASCLAHLHKVAVIEPANRVTRNGERPARRLALDFKVFSEEQETLALQWLAGQAQAISEAAASHTPQR